MKQELTSLELHFLLKEFNGWIGAKIDKIYHPKKKELELQLYQTGKGKIILRIMVPSFMYLTDYKQEQPDRPSGFCVFLRKYLDNARLKEVKQLGFERIIEFVFEKRDERFSLIFEMFSKGNIILCKEDYLIMSPLEIQRWKSRTVKPRVKYTYPQKEVNFLELTRDELHDLIDKSKKNLVKTLAIDLGLGGIYAEELCLLAKVDKNSKELTSKEIEKVIKSAEALSNKKSSPRIYFENGEVHAITPFDLVFFKEFEKKNVSSYNDALDQVLTKRTIKEVRSEKLSKHKTKLSKLEKIEKIQTARIKELENAITDNTKKAEHIYSNYQFIEGIISELNKARESNSWEEIKKKLKGHKTIKLINKKQKEITIEIK